MTRQRAVVRDAVQDLGHLEDLSDAPDLLLLVSERTLYVLQNLAISEIANSGRYATELLTQGYVPVREEDPEYALFKSVRDAAQLEILEVPMAGPIYGIQSTEVVNWGSTALTPGNFTGVLATVPAGEVWQLQAITLFCSPTAPSFCLIEIVQGSEEIVIAGWPSPGAGNTIIWLANQFFCQAGDIIRVWWFGVQAGDNLVSNLSYALLS